nr:MAG TPA_asm: hypothetical protein [Caudoviricetes sp.]
MLAVTSKSLCSRTQRHQNKQDSDYFFHFHLPCVDHLMWRWDCRIMFGFYP